MSELSTIRKELESQRSILSHCQPKILSSHLISSVFAVCTNFLHLPNYQMQSTHIKCSRIVKVENFIKEKMLKLKLFTLLIKVVVITCMVFLHLTSQRLPFAFCVSATALCSHLIHYTCHLLVFVNSLFKVPFRGLGG